MAPEISSTSVRKQAYLGSMCFAANILEKRNNHNQKRPRFKVFHKMTKALNKQNQWVRAEVLSTQTAQFAYGSAFVEGTPCLVVLKGQHHSGGPQKRTPPYYYVQAINCALCRFNRTCCNIECCAVRDAVDQHLRFRKYFQWMDHLLQKPQALIVFGDAETAAFAAARCACRVQRLTADGAYLTDRTPFQFRRPGAKRTACICGAASLRHELSGQGRGMNFLGLPHGC